MKICDFITENAKNEEQLSQLSYASRIELSRLKELVTNNLSSDLTFIEVIKLCYAINIPYQTYTSLVDVC